MPQPKQHWFRSKWFLAGCAVLCFLMTVSFVKELVRSYQINQEISSLRSSIDDLQQHNQKASDFVEYLKTDTYFQEQARLKLGLKENGEKVVVLQPGDGQTSVIPQNEAPRSLNDLLKDGQQPRSNPARWLAYFFGQK